MPFIVFSVVISAALLHATWNAIVKSAGDKFLTTDLPAFYGPGLASEMAVSGLVVDSRRLNSAGVSWPRLEWGRTSLN